MSKEPSSGTLARKLAKILGDVGKVEKTGHNSFHKYDYVTENDLVYAVRGKLAESGIFVFTSVEEQKVEVFRDEQTGKQSVLTLVKLRHTFVDGESGEEFSVFSQGQGSDVGDKGGYKAITGAMKYFLYKCFMIPTGDDPEGDDKTDERHAAGSGAQQRRDPAPAAGATGRQEKRIEVPRTEGGRYVLPDGVRWEDVVVHFGKNKGKKLGDLEANTIGWYLEKWEPKPYGASKDISVEDKMLLAGVNAWADEEDAGRSH